MMNTLLSLFLLLAAPAAETATHVPHTPIAIMQEEKPPYAVPSDEAKTIIETRAKEALMALRQKKMSKLATLVHPTKGLRFSPYVYVNPEEDLVFTRKQVAGLWSSRKRYVWGMYDAGEENIHMTFKKYYSRFVFSHDFTKAPNVGYNNWSYGNGTSINRIPEVYPDAIAVEHNFPGFDKRYDGMDWESLWLVFQKSGTQWYLVGIVHNEWTT